MFNVVIFFAVCFLINETQGPRGVKRKGKVAPNLTMIGEFGRDVGQFNFIRKLNWTLHQFMLRSGVFEFNSSNNIATPQSKTTAKCSSWY